ncbi:MAG: three-Cys-motif partner protein TcmP [Candidatus Marinimicrobia bacterium]|nr:three-Cys-motif partner protein TcmP [Candidatus Neomarinimicrobiota bacterium]
MLRSTIWDLKPHTLGKHKVLRNYLNGWLPIMARWNGRILFIDGFAGPGEYRGGEPGSPIIAMAALQEHKARMNIKAEVGFIFIEKDNDRVKHLSSLVKPMLASLPKTAWVNIHHSTFDEKLTEVLDKLDAQTKNLAPAFVMVDPFGVSGTPMSIIQRILGSPKSEVYISIQYEAINRHKDSSEFEEPLDALFGSSDWRKGRDIEGSDKRKNFFYNLYEQELRRAGAKHVLHFELYEGSRLVYAIFHGSQHELGSDLMKKAIWGVAPWGNFKFRPYGESQLLLDFTTPDLSPLQGQIENEFRGRNWVTIEKITSFVQSDRTNYHSGHLKKGALTPMEKQDRIEVDETTRKRKITYPPGTILRIKP